MTTEDTVGSMTPVTAYAALEGDPQAVLVDVRTHAEWSFVGVPDLSALGREPLLVEWRSYPDMHVNPAFVDGLIAAAGGTLPEQMLFICRSGARSLEAARTVADIARSQGLTPVCINVAEGFEGDLDPARRRGSVNGWKARGLPWRQS